MKVKSHIALPDVSNHHGAGAINRFFRSYYAAFILKKPVKATVLAFFSGIFALSVISMQHIKLGLSKCISLHDPALANL